jgi:hypothetical protein
MKDEMFNVLFVLFNKIDINGLLMLNKNPGHVHYWIKAGSTALQPSTPRTTDELTTEIRTSLH